MRLRNACSLCRNRREGYRAGSSENAQEERRQAPHGGDHTGQCALPDTHFINRNALHNTCMRASSLRHCARADGRWACAQGSLSTIVATPDSVQEFSVPTGIKVVDTNGAGDAFCGGFFAGLMQVCIVFSLLLVSVPLILFGVCSFVRVLIYVGAGWITFLGYACIRRVLVRVSAAPGRCCM